MTGVGIAVDVGGTTTRVALETAGSLVGDVLRFGTPSPRGCAGMTPGQAANALCDRLAAEIERIRLARPDSRSVAVAIGAVVGTNGVLRNASTLWLAPLTGLDIRGELRRRIPWAEVLVLNDLSAAAWHYRAHGRFAIVTVSTGVAIKVFDVSASGAGGLVLDPDGLGGESGHTPAGLPRTDILTYGATAARRLGRAAAAGDAAARAALDAMDLPWCECGAIADLCSYASGPAVARAATRTARLDPRGFAASALCRLADGDPERVNTRLIAAAAREDDLFTNGVLAAAVRPLAARILALAADLGLRKVVVVGGFAHGVGGPWLAALRGAIRDASVDAGWFTGWGDADFDDLLVFPDDQDISPLSGIAAYAHARRDVTRETVKPVGSGTLTVRSCSRPLCGREQFAVEVAFAGICSTDLQILRGERACEPGVPGHECVGRVTEVGAAVAGSLAVGDVVGLNPNGAQDGYGKLGHDVPGVFRDVFIGDLGLIARGQVIKLPAAGRSEWVLLELLAGVIRAQDALGDLAGRSLLVLGAGVAGMLHVMLARLRNASTVLVATRSRRRIDDAVRRGIVAPDETLPWGSGLAAAVRARTNDRGADAAVIALAGAAGPDAAAWLWPALAPDAVVHLFGGFPSGSVLRLGNGSTVDATAIRWAAARQETVSPSGVPVVLCGTRGGGYTDLVAARELCTAPEPALDLGRLVSHVITLDALPMTATELAAHGTIGGAPAWRAVIDMSRPGAYAGPLTGRPPALAGEAPP